MRSKSEFINNFGRDNLTVRRSVEDLGFKEADNIKVNFQEVRSKNLDCI
jgi:hypothetical protein